MDFKPNWSKTIGSILLGIVVEYTFEMYLFLRNNQNPGYATILPPEPLWFAYIILIIGIYVLWSIIDKPEKPKSEKKMKSKKKTKIEKSKTKKKISRGKKKK